MGDVGIGSAINSLNSFKREYIQSIPGYEYHRLIGCAKMSDIFQSEIPFKTLSRDPSVADKPFMVPSQHQTYKVNYYITAPLKVTPLSTFKIAVTPTFPPNAPSLLSPLGDSSGNVVPMMGPWVSPGGFPATVFFPTPPETPLFLFVNNAGVRTDRFTDVPYLAKFARKMLGNEYFIIEMFTFKEIIPDGRATTEERLSAIAPTLETILEVAQKGM